MLELELVLPCYNESRSLKSLVLRTKAAAERAGFGPERFRLVLVDNGSTDETAAVLKELEVGGLGPWFKSVNIPKNEGYGHGLLVGLRATEAPVIGWTHADQQCDPGDALKAYTLLASSNEEKLLVKGVRTGRDIKERFVSRVFEFFARVLLGLFVFEVNAQPKVFRRELLSALTSPPKNFAFDLYVLFRAVRQGYVIKSINVLFPPRIHGLSHWANNLLNRYKTIFGMISYMWKLRCEER